MSFQIPVALRQLFAYSPTPSSATTTTTTTNTNNNNDDYKGKRIVFIRHGCTYMNEYLSKPGCHFGAPQFTDVFTSSKDLQKYRDTLLSPRGMLQANSLARRLQQEPQLKRTVVDQLELVVVSPLTRALQTLELGLYPSLLSSSSSSDSASTMIPIVALPYAAERCYLISDIGTPRDELKTKFPFVDFESGFDKRTLQQDHCWWFTQEQYEKRNCGGQPYVEWRPNTQGQVYACPGEPEEVFEQRMMQLYQWLEARPESTIGLVSHWGVIRWMLNVDFRNCEMRVVPFDQVRPNSLFAEPKLLV
jgi:broad specificity phosphatase PhoE